MVTHYNESRSQVKVYDIDTLQNAFSKVIDPILFVHAMTGCDTTSAPFNRVKTVAYNLLKSNRNLVREVSVFCRPNQSQSAICEAGETFLLAMYNATQISSLDTCWFYRMKR